MSKLRAQKPQIEPDMVIMTCEAPGCDVQRPRRECFSFIAAMAYAHLERGEYHSYQCPDEQHWCCCHEHAKLAVLTCVDEHHSADKLQQRDVGPNPKLLLAHITHCALASCSNTLDTEAYCVPISYATPGLGYAAYACDPMDMHWACSEEHAKQAAALCLEEHLEGGQHG